MKDAHTGQKAITEIKQQQIDKLHWNKITHYKLQFLKKNKLLSKIWA